jgi:hypothetical protein
MQESGAGIYRNFAIGLIVKVDRTKFLSQLTPSCVEHRSGRLTQSCAARNVNEVDTHEGYSNSPAKVAPPCMSHEWGFFMPSVIRLMVGRPG